MHLNMAAVLVLSKCQAAENMEKTPDLLRTQVVHVVQNSLDHKKSWDTKFQQRKELGYAHQFSKFFKSSFSAKYEC